MQNLLSLYILHVKYIKIINLYEGIFWVDPKNLSTHKCGAEIDAVVLDQSAVDMVPGDVKFPADKLSALSSFKKLSDEDVRALVTKSAKSYCALIRSNADDLLLDCLAEVLPVISYLVNSSLVNGYFPMDWKEALVKPLLKKPGLEAQFKNLRPISNLQFL